MWGFQCEAFGSHWGYSLVQQRKPQPLKLDSDPHLNHFVRISWLRINLFITKMNLPLPWAGITMSFKVYHNKMMLLFSVYVLPVLCLVLRRNKCHLAALGLLDVIHLTELYVSTMQTHISTA